MRRLLRCPIHHSFRRAHFSVATASDGRPVEKVLTSFTMKNFKDINSILSPFCKDLFTLCDNDSFFYRCRSRNDWLWNPLLYNFAVAINVASDCVNESISYNEIHL